MSDIDLRVMLIAGGSGSIGREIAAQALTAGWTVILHGRHGDKLERVAAELRGRADSAALHTLAIDIGDDGDIEQLVDRAEQIHGRLDAVVDCLAAGPVGAKVTGSFADTDPAAYQPFLALSLVALQRLAFAALPWLRESGGCLIALVSDAGVFAAPGQTLIGAARAASVGFIKNFALDVANCGVRAHCISPSFVDATATALKLEQIGSRRLESARRRAGLGLPTPADIAPLVLFLCGDGARKITGQVISVNGGLNA